MRSGDMGLSAFEGLDLELDGESMAVCMLKVISYLLSMLRYR
jgi:hypothetical protein